MCLVSCCLSPIGIRFTIGPYNSPLACGVKRQFFMKPREPRSRVIAGMARTIILIYRALPAHGPSALDQQCCYPYLSEIFSKGQNAKVNQSINQSINIYFLRNADFISLPNFRRQCSLISFRRHLVFFSLVFDIYSPISMAFCDILHMLMWLKASFLLEPRRESIIYIID